MNKKMCVKLASKLDGFRFVSKFKYAKILVDASSNEELFKGVRVQNSPSGILVHLWVCSLIYFEEPIYPLMTLSFDGWQFDGKRHGWISKNYKGAPKEESVLLQEVADYISDRIKVLEGVKNIGDILLFANRFPASFSHHAIRLQLGLLYYCSGEKTLGESMIRQAYMSSKESDEPKNEDVEEFLLSLDKGGDATDQYIMTMKVRNRSYLEANGFLLGNKRGKNKL